VRTFSSLLLALLTLTACSSGGNDTTGSGGSGGGTTSSTSSGDTTSSTSTGGTTGTPIDAPEGQWTWIPFDNAFCADGSTTGIGVNLSKTSSRVIIYLEGGGACWNELTCYTLKTASNIEGGYGEKDFLAESQSASYLALPGGFFDRSAADNPLKDYSYVYVPYCTGDIHAGDNTASYGTHTTKHAGFANITAYLGRLVPTFPSAERVFIAGSSAGGFGAAFNWWQVQQAFGKIRVDLIDDSGTLMPADIPAHAYEPDERTNWGLAKTLPAGCTGCDQSLDALLAFYIQQFPDHRGALLSYSQDTVLPGYFGITTAQFQMGLNELAATYFDPHQNMRYFIDGGSGHVLWFSPQLAQNGVTVQQFVAGMVNDSKSWSSVKP
jgi:hypothetical protein